MGAYVIVVNLVSCYDRGSFLLNLALPFAYRDFSVAPSNCYAFGVFSCIREIQTTRRIMSIDFLSIGGVNKKLLACLG